MWYHHDVGFKFNFWKFTKNLGIEVSYNSSRDLQLSLKSQKNKENNKCILANQLYRFSHQIPSYKMSHHRKKCIPRCCFELNLTALSTNKFQLTKEHDKAQKNLLEVHSHHHIKECIPRGCFDWILLPCQLTSFNWQRSKIQFKEIS